MLECSGAASAVNVDVMYCKDVMIRGKGFLFFYSSLWILIFDIEQNRTRCHVISTCP